MTQSQVVPSFPASEGFGWNAPSHGPIEQLYGEFAYQKPASSITPNAKSFSADDVIVAR